MFAKVRNSDPQNVRWGDLMRSAQAGDATALRTLYTEISPIILAFCRKRAGYLGIPEDALQVSLMAIHRNRHVYLADRSFKAWMFAIVRTKLIDELRKHQRIEKIEQRTARDVTSRGISTYSNVRGEETAELNNSEGDASGNEQVEALRAAISQLPDKYRKAIALVKLEGYSIKEAAELEGISESSIKVRAHRGFRMLVKELTVEK